MFHILSFKEHYYLADDSWSDNTLLSPGIFDFNFINSTKFLLVMKEKEVYIKKKDDFLQCFSKNVYIMQNLACFMNDKYFFDNPLINITKSSSTIQSSPYYFHVDIYSTNITISSKFLSKPYHLAFALTTESYMAINQLAKIMVRWIPFYNDKHMLRNDYLNYFLYYYN